MHVLETVIFCLTKCKLETGANFTPSILDMLTNSEVTVIGFILIIDFTARVIL